MIEGIDHLGLRLVDQPVGHVGGRVDPLVAVLAGDEREQVDQVMIVVESVHDLVLLMDALFEGGVKILPDQRIAGREGLDVVLGAGE